MGVHASEEDRVSLIGFGVRTCPTFDEPARPGNIREARRDLLGLSVAACTFGHSVKRMIYAIVCHDTYLGKHILLPAHEIKHRRYECGSLSRCTGVACREVGAPCRIAAGI